MKTGIAHDELVRVQATTDHLLQRSEDGWVIGHFFNNRLSSVFQPVLDVNDRQIIGHATYIRSGADHANVLSPWAIFALAAEDTLLVNLDRLCRIVHAINYFSTASGPGNLFVSVQPRLLESVKDDHGRAFAEVLDLIGVATSRVVIEIPAEVNRDWWLLRHVISNYRSRGYRIAANHSGASDNWMAELGSLYPDIVRQEASTLLQHTGSDPLLETVHRFGASSAGAGHRNKPANVGRDSRRRRFIAGSLPRGTGPYDRNKQVRCCRRRGWGPWGADERRMMVNTESIGALS